MPKKNPTMSKGVRF